METWAGATLLELVASGVLFDEETGGLSLMTPPPPFPPLLPNCSGILNIIANISFVLY